MRWRDGKRAAILETLLTTSRSGKLASPYFKLPCSKTRFHPRENIIACETCSINEGAVSARAVYATAVTLLNCRPGTIRLEIVPTFASGDLDQVDVRVFNVDLRISLDQHHKMAFTSRADVGLFNTRPPTTHRAPLHRVKIDTPKPVTEKTATLEERLRWILTPPVHELLSDPSLGLPHTPYEYQVKGIGWLRGRQSALLADEMGLGKTMQAIIAARLLWRESAIKLILVVCPKTLVRTWRNEIATWWPNASMNISETTGDTQWFLKLATPNITIKIINYEKLAREAEWLMKEDRSGAHDLIILDEAQRIKNPSSKTAKAVKALKGMYRWALTGTPLETKTGDVVSIFDFVRRGLLEGEDPDYVRTRIKPFILRRRVDDVLKDLPAKDDRDVELDLSDRHREAYERAQDDGVVALNEKGDTITVQHVFALIQKLMQLCNFDPLSGDSVKLERFNEDVEEIIESGRKVLLFSQFVSEPFGLKQIKRHLPTFCRVVEMHGEISQRNRDAAIDGLNNDPEVNTMLLHYRVGGLGLNLQSANYVYLFDRWWNPSVEDQAVKRVHRIGQKNTVFIRRFFCKDTIEERILKKLAERRRLFSHVIDDNKPHEAMGLTEEELFSLFSNLKARPKRSRSATAPPQVVLGNMDDKEFENLVAKVYEAQGFRVRVVGGSHDGGIDIIAERNNIPGRDRIVIQCKHMQANVGRPDLQKLWGVVNDDQRITRGDIVTSSGFSSEAIRFAADKRLELIDRKKLSELVVTHKVAEFVSI